MMSEIRCPKCGSPMILRTAKRGINAGRKFYGCSRYPQCNGTRPSDDETTEQIQSEKIKLSPSVNYFPQSLLARSRFQGYQVRFFETVALPENLLEKIKSEDREDETLKAFSQWRIDFPSRDTKFILTEAHSQIISVIEKILTRGRITLPSPQIEKEFKEIFKISKNEFSLLDIESLVLKGYEKAQKDIWLDSDEEKIFYSEILPRFLGKNYQQFVIPQVEISSLLPSVDNKDIIGYQKIDFSLFHPNLNEKIIIKIDDKQHQSHNDSDHDRDEVLQQLGYVVIHIQANELREGESRQLTILKSKLSKIKEKLYKEIDASNDNITKFLYSIKFSHQIQLIILQAIQSGFLNLEDKDSWHIFSDLDELGIFNKSEALSILNKSVLDFIELFEKLSKLYSVELNISEPFCNLISDYLPSKTENAIFISFSDRFSSDLPTFYVQNIYFPFHISNSSFPAMPIKGLKKPDEKDLEYFLRYLFRKSNFWEGQYDGIVRALQGKDALLLLPTGAGKSLVYQLASLLLPGRTVVIDPIISLMEDQIDNLAMVGIDRCIAITSQIIDSSDRMRALELFGQGEYLFAYVAPERFQTNEFRESLRSLTVHTPIALIVVDEAHCVSEWGHDFRTAYLNIGRTSRNYCESNGIVPPLIALTGTASRAVLKDVQRELLIDDFDAIITPKSFDRPELKFRVIHSTSQEKAARLKGYLGQMLPSLFNTTISSFFETRGKGTYSGLIFCPHVGGEFGVEQVAQEIKEDLKIPTAIYSGKEPKNWNSTYYQYHKQHVTKNFKRNKIPLLVCTKSFGMGIDKPNIRYTIHYGIPPSIESFYQEAGRAGRDKKIAHCCIIVSNDYPERSRKLLNPSTTVEEINKIVKNLKWEENDDITRILYFHTNSFRGIEKEKQDIEEVLWQLGDISQKGIKILTIPDKIKLSTDEYKQPREITEKALHRLLLIGVINDYTIDYSRDEFTVKLSGASKEEIIETYGKYIESYLYSRKQIEVEKAMKLISLPLHEFIMEITNLLLHFIYDVIERGRRRAIYEMLLACTNSPTDEAIRQRILRYLEITEYSESLEQIVNDQKVGLTICKDVFGLVRSPNDAAELRGQVSRYLESYPDHPALLMLRSLSEIFSKDRNSEVVKQNFLASISSALINYGLSDNVVFDFASWALSNIVKKDIEIARELVSELTKSSNRSQARLLIEKLPIKLADIPAWLLLERLQLKCSSLLLKREI